MRKYIILKCQNCSIDYTAREDQKNRSRFCSRQCIGKFMSGNKRSSKKKSVDKKCSYCQCKFTVNNYRKDSAKYCSITCSRKGSLTQRLITCIVCQKEFGVIHARINTAKYCSQICYKKNRKVIDKESRICFTCGIYYAATKRSGKKYCSIQCCNKQKIKDGAPSFAAVRANMKKAGEINICERCGYKEHPHILGIHHKDRDRSNNQRNNLEVLCPNCHILEHLSHTCHGFQE